MNGKSSGQGFGLHASSSCTVIIGLPRWLSGKESTCQGRRFKRYGFDPWVSKNPGVGNGNPLQYFCLENPMNWGAWQATVHDVAKSQTRLCGIAHAEHNSYMQGSAVDTGLNPEMSGPRRGHFWLQPAASSLTILFPPLPNPSPPSPTGDVCRR